MIHSRPPLLGTKKYAKYMSQPKSVSPFRVVRVVRVVRGCIPLPNKITRLFLQENFVPSRLGG
jgi:hypothetical protein